MSFVSRAALNWRKAAVSQLVSARGKTTRHIPIFDDRRTILELLRSVDLTERQGSKLV
jgi:hypothetical protein